MLSIDFYAVIRHNLCQLEQQQHDWHESMLLVMQLYANEDPLEIKRFMQIKVSIESMLSS